MTAEVFGVVVRVSGIGGFPMTRSRIVSALAVAVLGVSVLPSVWAVDGAADSRLAAPTVSAVNARRALGTTVSELNVDNVALSRVMDFLRDVSGANIVVNWKVLEGAGVAKDTPISLQVRELSLRKMLRLVLDQASPNALLVYNLDSNVVEITSQEEADKHMITKVYVVDDLVMTDNSTVVPPVMNLSTVTQSGSTSGGSGGLGGGGGGGGAGLFSTSTDTNANGAATETTQKKGEDLAALVREVVRPTIWRENGGTASIRYFSGKLIVTAPQSVHEAIGGPMAPEGGQRFGM
jgi:hypothetical protein